METPILADSNVYINILRAGYDPAEVLVEDYDTVDLVTCGMVKLEVLRGVRHPKALKHLSAFFSVHQYLESDFEVWEEAIGLSHALARIGVNIPNQDIIIATFAFRTGATVLTADKHFSLIPNLPVIDSPY